MTPADLAPWMSAVLLVSIGLIAAVIGVGLMDERSAEASAARTGK